MKFNDFLSHCTAQGGDWTRMLMTGIQEVAPAVWEAMPDRPYGFDEVTFIVNHLCYDRPHFRFNLSIDGEIIEHSNEGKFLFRKATPEELAMTAEEFHRKYNDPFDRGEEFGSTELRKVELQG